ncbi:MAG: hypothetical protein O2921_03535 [Chloroflexi bacterium]|nr:hypothetical protein [Chloroflexota bacterium]
MRLSNEIHSALYGEDIAGLEQIIKKVGAEAAFGVFLTEDFSGRRLIHYMENYPSGLRESRGFSIRTGIHPEFLALALKYDPELKLGRRLRYLHVCDSFLGRCCVGRFRGRGMARVSGIDEESVVKFRNLILDSAPADEKILMQKLCLIKGEHHSKPE